MVSLLKRGLLIAFIISIYLFITRGSKTATIIRLAGSTAFQPFAEKLADVYMEKNESAVIDVQGGGSALGIMAVNQGIVDIGMADMLQLPRVVSHLTKVVCARDGIAVIVHKDNPIENISKKQLQDIFTGKITNWQKVGVSPAPLRVISREDGSGTRKSFDQIVLKKNKLTINAMYQDSNGTIREAVKSDENAIGYISIGFINSSVKTVDIDGINATNENVKNGKYTLARPIYLILKKDIGQDARQFIDFLLSNEAQTIISKNGLIPVK